MPMATYAIPGFLGGEISLYAQGRFDKPDYRLSLNVCLNSFPVEIGTWTRRPGTQYGGHTRGGSPGRVVEFDFEQSNPITMEFTDGWLRFRNGPSLLTTNDTQTVLAISTANPAVVRTAAANTWATGNTTIFPPGVPLLENRQFKITVIDSTHFSLQDALTGANIDGSTLGTIPALTVQRVQELQTVYGAGSWAKETMRAVQAETTSFLLNNGIFPQAVTVASLPTLTSNGAFAVGAVNFLDGPYLDPFTNGVQAVASAVSGIVTINLQFPAYSSTTAYAKGEFVTSSSVNYESLVDQNVNNTPVSSPSQWLPVSAGAAINGGLGFLGTDVGRLMRLFSEPAAFSSAATYATGGIVSYNPSGIPGGNTYWSSLISSNTGNVPGKDITKWSLLSTDGAALWTWGKIVSLTNIVDRTAGTAIGSMTNGGGLAAAFNGTFSQIASSSAEQYISVPSTTLLHNTALTMDSYVGKNFTGSAKQIFQATVYPSIDAGIGSGSYTKGGSTNLYVPTFVVNLRAKATLPASPSDGTLLGTTGSIPNTTSAITILSNDSATSWNFVWVEIIATFINTGFAATSYQFSNSIGQVSYFNPTGTGTGSSVNVEILGPALLYSSTPVLTWQLGVYSNTTGYPTCGCYHEGRLWLGGAVANRFDASVSNGVTGATVNFAPTDQFGVVADNAAISETLNSNSVNPIHWMKPSLEGVIIGTQNGETLVQAPTTGPISPTNIAARIMTKHGSQNIEPVRTPHANIIIKRYGRKMLEFFADAFSGKYSAPNLSDKAEHVVANGIAEIAFTEATTPIIWGYDTLGNLFGVTYKRDQLVTSQPPDFYGSHRHALGSARIIESVCSGASVGGDLDALTMVTNDPSTNIRHVEVMTDASNEATALVDSWFLDDAINPTSTSTTNATTTGFPYGGLTINGLWHLNGKTVQVFAGGLDCGDRGPGTTGYTDFVVSNGSITVPYGDSISSGPGRGLFTAAFAVTANIVIGFTYNSDGQTVRQISPTDSGARNGPALGKVRRNHRYAMLLVNTLGLSVGTVFTKLNPAIFRPNGGTLPALTTFSGVHQDSLQDDYSYDGMMCWRVSRPFPANIAAISGNIETQDQ